MVAVGAIENIKSGPILALCQGICRREDILMRSTISPMIHALSQSFWSDASSLPLNGIQ